MTTKDLRARLGLPAKGAIVATDGDKGGVGKSFTGRTLAHCMHHWGVPWLGVDGDPRNAHLARYYGATASVARMPLRQASDWDQLLDYIEKAVPEDHVVLIDTPAGAGDMVRERGPWLKALAAHLGRNFLRLFALDEEDDVLMALARTRDTLGYDNVAAVLNGRFGSNPEAFELWNEPTVDGSSLRQQVLAAGGLEVYAPALPVRVRAHVRRERIPFHQAKNLDALTFADHRNLEAWLLSIQTAFAPLRARL